MNPYGQPPHAVRAPSTVQVAGLILWVQAAIGVLWLLVIGIRMFGGNLVLVHIGDRKVETDLASGSPLESAFVIAVVIAAMCFLASIPASLLVPVLAGTFRLHNQAVRVFAFLFQIYVIVFGISATFMYAVMIGTSPSTGDVVQLGLMASFGILVPATALALLGHRSTSAYFRVPKAPPLPWLAPPLA